MRWFEQGLSKILDLGVRFPRKNKQEIFVSFATLLTLGLVLILAVNFFSYVDLKPKIGENFFFSNDDPQLQEERKIQEIFPQDAQLIIGVKGNLHSEVYLTKIGKLTEDLAGLKGVIGVQSIPNGPRSLENALRGPLWSRVLVAQDQQASFIQVFVEPLDPELFIPQVEEIIRRYDGSDFSVMVSGQPYISELLRRYLFKDLKIFSVAAFVIFGVLMLLIFRSINILVGTLVACTSASMSTLILSQYFGMETGPLNANLATIVFVLTLSHIVFLTFNHKRAIEESKCSEMHPVIEAVHMTFQASFWSMFTTFLGFLSLLFVPAAPLKQLGLSGALGTAVSFFLAYIVFPPFLKRKSSVLKNSESGTWGRVLELFFYRKHKIIFMVFMGFSLYAAFGIRLINTDPSLFAYFKKGGEIRNGLEYVDQNGGSSPLFLVVQDPKRQSFDKDDGLVKLWVLTKALEEHPAVGSVVSIPVILAEAKRNFFARFLSSAWIIDILDSEKYGKVSRYFISSDRMKSLLLLRMQEEGRTQFRTEIMEELKNIVEKQNLTAYLMGGVYSLQGRMASLVRSSILSGLLLLLGMFVAIGWFLAKNGRIPFAMLLSLATIPAGILGLIGYMKMPLDVIAAPAANIAIGMGVDSMMHMLIFVQKNSNGHFDRWLSWKKACINLWRPVLYTAVIIGAGFGIFAFSNFPPTQRFGFMVMIGAVISPFAALIGLTFMAHLLRTKTSR